jgi:prepilin-type processing-associated H-X9-DG protein
VVRENQTKRFYSYGLNRMGTDGGQGLGYGSDGRSEVPVLRVKMPEEMIAITDTGVGLLSKYQAKIEPNTLVVPVGNVHRGGANVLWCDGHVDWRRKEEITFTDSEGHYASRQPKYFRVAPLWNSSHKALPNG